MPSTLLSKPKYEHLCYVFQPVDPGQFPHNPHIYCVHNNNLTDGGNWIGKDWQTKNWGTSLRIEHAQVIGRYACINTDDIVRMIMHTGEQTKTSNEAAFKEGMRRLLREWVPPAPSPQAPRQGEADIYEVKVLSHWPETLKDPDAEPGNCRVM